MCDNRSPEQMLMTRYFTIEDYDSHPAGTIAVFHLALPTGYRYVSHMAADVPACSITYVRPYTRGQSLDYQVNIIDYPDVHGTVVSPQWVEFYVLFETETMEGPPFGSIAFVLEKADMPARHYIPTDFLAPHYYSEPSPPE